MRQPDVKIICIPTEASTHWAGQCKAPDAMIKTGRLSSRLESAGYQISIEDQVLSSDVYSKAAAWTLSPKKNRVRNEDNTITVMKAIQNYVQQQEQKLKAIFPVVLGVDCSITPAVLSGLNSWHDGIRQKLKLACCISMETLTSLYRPKLMLTAQVPS